MSTILDTTRITVPTGSVTAPPITADGDNNTGIYFPAADTIAFTEGGAESFRIASPGKLAYAPTALGAASAGLFEYDGVAPYFTPAGTQRGVIPGIQYYRLNTALALAASTSAQNIFGVGVTLASNTVYQFSALYAFIKTTTTTSHTWGMGFGGTATINNIGYGYYRYFETSGFNVANVTSIVTYVTTANNTTVIGASTSSTNYQWTLLNGTVSIDTGGTFIPQITLTAVGPIYTTQVGSYFAIYPVSASGSNTSIGAWA